MTKVLSYVLYALFLAFLVLLSASVIATGVNHATILDVPFLHF
jgi:hypothetical protein